jgi:hypothetical protein
LAARGGHNECVQELLKAGVGERDGAAACAQAAQRGHLATVQRLLEHESRLLASLNFTALQRLCGQGDDEQRSEARNALPSQELRSCHRRLCARLGALEKLEFALLVGDMETLQETFREPSMCPDAAGWLDVTFGSGLTPLGLAVRSRALPPSLSLPAYGSVAALLPAVTCRDSDTPVRETASPLNR